MLQKIFCVLILCFCCLLAQAQSTQDVIYLKNGSVIRGQIVLLEPSGIVKIEIYGGSVLVYDVDEVLKISKESSKDPNKIKKTNHKFSGRGFTHRISIETMLGQGQWGLVPGLGHHYQCNYHLNRFFSFGAGMGINTFFDLSFVPVYANFKGYFMKSSASVYYDINVGYGIILPSYHVSSSGGLYIRPAVGVRFHSTTKAHLFLDFGYNIQYASTVEIDWNNNPVSYERIYYRPSLRLGITF